MSHADFKKAIKSLPQKTKANAAPYVHKFAGYDDYSLDKAVEIAKCGFRGKEGEVVSTVVNSLITCPKCRERL